MKLYVAGRFTNKVMVRELQRLLRQAGHTITYDWTGNDATGLEGAERTRYLRTCALSDRRGVLEAEGVAVLHDPTGAGLFTELGLALAPVPAIPIRRVVVIGAVTELVRERCIFYYLPEVIHVATAEECVAEFN